VRPAPFAYARPDTVAEATELLAANSGRASVLAGGQTLIAQLNRRAVRPALVVDLKWIDGLRGMAENGTGGAHIAALTTHREVETGCLPTGFEVLRETTRFIAHAPVRIRGTIGGSLMNADPRAEWPTLSILLDAEVTLVGTGGERRMRADALLVGDRVTSAEPDEILVAVDIPAAPDAAGVTEFAYRPNDLALVIAGVALHRDCAGAIERAAIALGGVGGPVHRITAAETLLVGAAAPEDGPLDPALCREVGAVAAVEIEPVSDHHASAAYRRELAAVLVERALLRARTRPSRRPDGGAA